MPECIVCWEPFECDRDIYCSVCHTSVCPVCRGWSTVVPSRASRGETQFRSPLQVTFLTIIRARA